MATSKPLPEAINEWIDALRGMGRSNGTIGLYTITVKQFFDHAGNIFVKNINPQHMDKFFSAHPEWGARTRGMKQNHLSLFIEWCRARGYIARANDPLFGRQKPKVPKIERLRISRDRFGEVLNLAPNPRDRMIVGTLLYLLCRDSEARVIRWKDVLWEQDEVYIYARKTGQDDHLPMSAELREELERWKHYFESTYSIIQPDWYVLSPTASNPPRDPITGKWLTGRITWEPQRPLQRLVPRIIPILEAMDYDLYRDGSHTLRRSGARELFEALSHTESADKALRIVQSMLGHASLAQTEAYIGLERDRQSRNKAIKGKRMYGEPAKPEGKVISLKAVA